MNAAAIMDTIECSTPSLWDRARAYTAPQATRSYDPVVLREVPAPPINENLARRVSSLDLDIYAFVKQRSTTRFAIQSQVGFWFAERGDNRPSDEVIENAIRRLIAKGIVFINDAGRFEARR